MTSAFNSRFINCVLLCDALFAGNTTLALDPFDLGTQPAGECLLNLDLVARAVQIIETLSVLSERNEPARHRLAALLLRHELRQQTAFAWIGMRHIREIGADGRVLENCRGSPRRTRKAPISPVQQEVQFELQNLQNVATVLGHRSPQLNVRMPEGICKHCALRHRESWSWSQPGGAASRREGLNPSIPKCSAKRQREANHTAWWRMTPQADRYGTIYGDGEHSRGSRCRATGPRTHTPSRVTPARDSNHNFWRRKTGDRGRDTAHCGLRLE